MNDDYFPILRANLRLEHRRLDEGSSPCGRRAIAISWSGAVEKRKLHLRQGIEELVDVLTSFRTTTILVRTNRKFALAVPVEHDGCEVRKVIQSCDELGIIGRPADRG